MQECTRICNYVRTFYMDDDEIMIDEQLLGHLSIWLDLTHSW